MKKFRTLMAAVALAVMTPVVGNAQAWKAFAGGETPGAFWATNNSMDGRDCNIGDVLAGVAGTTTAPNAPTTCRNQRPAGWLPYEGDRPTQYFDRATFNLFTIDPFLASFTFHGDIANADRAWGFFTVQNGVRKKYNLNPVFGTTRGTIIRPAEVFPNAPLWNDGDVWGLWISTTNNRVAYSDRDGQFAWFRTLDENGLTVSNHFGLEDILSSGDRDFNDVVFSVTTAGGDLSVVPEPSTYALMATGLLGLGAVSRRRKKLA